MEKNRLNIAHYLALNAERTPDKPALLYPVRITFGEMQEEVDRYAFGLKSIGISKGKKTILMVSAGPEFFILTFALLRVGAVPVMIDPGMGIKAMVNALSGIDADAFIGIPKAHILRRLYPVAFKTVRIWITHGRRWFSGGYRLALLRSETKQGFPACLSNPDDLAAIFFTSGSTGPPKGVCYRAGMLDAQIQILSSHFKYGPEEIDLCTFPLLSLFSICRGMSVVIADMDPVHPATLDPKKIISNIREYECTQMFGSPMVLDRLARYANSRNVLLPSLKRVISAGAPVSRNILESFLKISSGEVEIHTPYGATEALPVTDITASELLDNPIAVSGYDRGICVGYTLKGIEIRIIEIEDTPISNWDDKIELPVNSVGEIVVRGAWVTREYINQPRANSLAKIESHQEGQTWHRMGDIGRLDSEGRLWYYGRKSHRVITDKGILFSIPTEAIFNRHPRVARSALVGIHEHNEELMTPAICIEFETGDRGFNKKKLIGELLQMGKASEATRDISHFLFPGRFPVDARHNAKIFREKLARWASKKIQ